MARDTRARFIRRARSIVCHWEGEQLIVTNYRTRALLKATPVTILLLNLLDHWLSPAEVADFLARFPRGNVIAAVAKLLRCGLVVRKHSTAASEDEAFQKSWGSWLPHAGFFHFGTKDVPYESRPKELLKLERTLLRGGPQPAFYKTYAGSDKIRLERPRSELGFPRILLQRRTHRTFSRQDLPFAALSKLLFYTWGVTGRLQQPILGALPLKTSASAGARHPIEVYLLGLRIAGVKPGLYHYDPRRHRLELIRLMANAPWKAAQFCVGQRWAKQAAALFIMTAVFPRSMWKYPTSRAYRTVLLDAGHLGQTFYLVATWLGLAPFCTMALRDSLIEKEIGIDGVVESVIYIAGIGTPPPDSPARKRRNLSFALL